VSSDEEEATGGASARASARDVRHGVADAIAARATKMKMVESVRIECSIAPRHGIVGLQSVSL
jgi:hypothetical protein